MIQHLSQLCQSLSMPQPVTEELIVLSRELPFSALEPAMEQLLHADTWDSGLSLLTQQLGEDPRGLKMLTCMLVCAEKTRENYRRRGIPDDIFLATMDCFPRFVREHMESFGRYGFDRDFWTVRQLSGVLMRIGLLEYEFKQGTISLHIPSGTRLLPADVDASLAEARCFIARFFPEWKDASMACHSWLLSPTLKTLLPENSNILHFQKRFHITPQAEPDPAFLVWVFKTPNLPLSRLPENTHLQRVLKRYLLEGGSFLDARGILA